MKLCLGTNHPSELVVAHSFGSAHCTDGKTSPAAGSIVPYASGWIRCRDLALWTTRISPLLCAVSTALVQRHLVSQRTQGKVKSWISPAVAFPLPASFPAGQSPAASMEHASLLLKEKKVNLQQARVLPHSCPPAAETSSGLLCPHPISSLPNCSNFRSIRSGI